MPYPLAPDEQTVSLGNHDSLPSIGNRASRKNDPRHNGPFHAPVAKAYLLSDEEQPDHAARQSVGSGHFGREDIGNHKWFGDWKVCQVNPSQGVDESRHDRGEHCLGGYARASMPSVRAVGISTHGMVTGWLSQGAGVGL